MNKKFPRRDFVKGALGILGGVAASLASSRLANGAKNLRGRPKPMLATLTVNSLSITPKSEWPIHASNGLWAARDEVTYDSMVADTLMCAPTGVSVPSSSTEGTWSGTPSVQTDFSP